MNTSWKLLLLAYAKVSDLEVYLRIRRLLFDGGGVYTFL